MPWTQNGCKCLELIWIPSSHNCWKNLPEMLRTMKVSWPIARTTANQKSATPGTRNPREKEKRISSEKHQGTDYSRAEHWSTGPVEGKNRKVLRYLQAVYSSINSYLWPHKWENSQDLLPSPGLSTHMPPVSEFAWVQYFLGAHYSQGSYPNGFSAMSFYKIIKASSQKL